MLFRSHLTKLSQFAGAYATTTIDKSTEVKILLKQREDKIKYLERLLEEEKSNSSEQMELKCTNFKRISKV